MSFWGDRNGIVGNKFLIHWFYYEEKKFIQINIKQNIEKFYNTEYLGF